MKRFFNGLLAAISVCALLVPVPLRAAQPPMVFTHLTTAEGLSQATVNTIHQDSHGFLWFGTENGLNRYDGNQVKRYYRERNRVDGLASDFIRALDEDTFGNLWIATEGSGLVMWHRRSDTFTSYRHDPDNPGSLASDYIRDVLVDSVGRVWAATRDKGLDRLDPDSGDITHFVHDSRPGSLSSNRELHALLETNDGSIWVGTSAGLDRYHESRNRFEHFTPPVAPSGVHTLFSLMEDRRGDLWLGSFDAGLLHFDRKNEQFTQYKYSAQDPTSLPHDQVSAVFEDSARRLWVGTSGGLSLFDRVTRTFQTYTHDRSQPRSLAGNTIRTIGEDRHGLLWIGTGNSGVSRWNSRSWSLGHRIPQWLQESSMINAFADADDDALWIGSAAGLHRMQAGGAVTHVAGSETLGDDMVMSLLADRQGQVWIGTMLGGLSVRHTDGSFTQFRAVDGGLGADGIMGLHEDRSGLIWIGTFEGGVSVYDPASGTLRRYPDASGKFPGFERARATVIRQDSQGRIWVGTSGEGLYIIDLENGQLHQLRHDATRPGSLAADTVYGLHMDAAGGAWVGTGGSGLDYVADTAGDAAQLRFDNLSRAEGLANDVIYAIVEDDAGYLWLPSNNGLMRLDPQNREIRSYHASHGAQSEEYSFGAYLKSRSGRLLFAGTQGYNDFDPLKLPEDTLPPDVAITRIEVQNQPLVSPVAVSMLQSLELAHHENALSLEFAALDFADPARNQFAYRLAGFDDNWIPLRNEHRVSYTNLPPGNYVFQVKAAGSDSVWNENGVQLAITVRPAPWRTWWAYCLYAAIALLLLFMLYRQQTRRFREQEKYATRLASEVEARTAELHQRNTELAEASAAKSNFLARMSHEIRTPMNGVMGMAELLSSTRLDSQQQHYTHTISRSAKNLLQIINDILDLSKIEAGHVELEARSFDLEHLVDDCLALLAQQANKKGIELVASVDPLTPRRLVGDSLRLQQVLTNLVGNALKFTSEGEVLVRTDVQKRGAEHLVIRLEITDTGIGITEEALGNVFDAFSQVDETTTRKFGGTGLGLSICKQLVELMGGQIGVHSKLNVGTTFWCELPLGVDNAAPLADERGGIAGLNILVVSPEMALRDAISRRLLAEGAATVAVDAGANMERLLDRQPPYDVIVLDADRVNPGDGEPEHWEIPRIILSRDAAPQTPKTRRRPRDQWLSKPAALREVKKSILAACSAADAAETKPRADSAALTRLPTGGQKRVLVVEDNEVNQMVAQGMLSQLGYSTSIASDGQGAIALLSTEHFDAVLMDCQMPGMDGFEATRHIRAAEQGKKRTPIIGLTAHASSDSRDACLDAGMDDFLSKPYSAADLDEVLSRWLTGTQTLSAS